MENPDTNTDAKEQAGEEKAANIGDANTSAADAVKEVAESARTPQPPDPPAVQNQGSVAAAVEHQTQSERPDAAYRAAPSPQPALTEHAAIDPVQPPEFPVGGTGLKGFFGYLETKFKAWVRAELALAIAGVPHEDRKSQNP